MSSDTGESQKGYALFQIEVTDHERFGAEYVPPTMETIEAHGGRVLVSAGAPEVLEGEWAYNRTVVVEFPTVEDARAWYDDETYREATEVRHETTGAENVVIVPGVSGT